MVGRIVVLVSGSGSNMEALVRACRTGEVPAEVVAVVADRPCTGLERATAAGVATMLVEPRSYSSRDEWSEALRDRVLACAPDLVVSAGFMRILAPAFVGAFEGKLINLHPSLLPAFRGAHAVREALEAGVQVTGTTVHFVDEEVDHGGILLQEPVGVFPEDDEDSLHERIKKVEHQVLPDVCRLLLEGKVRLSGKDVVWDPTAGPGPPPLPRGPEVTG
ncbi:MAG: phosphoribosylglycinamide formyltransferase [Actinomycetota bacterium]